MFPIRDNIPSRTRPVINYAIIVVTALVFFAQLSELSSTGTMKLIEQYGMIPARVLDPGAEIAIRDIQVVETPRGPRQIVETRAAAPTPIPPWLTLLTSVFLHGGWLHIIGNLWFLYIFGDNVEDCLGHGRYLLFYLVAGAGAGAAHLIASPGSTVPTIGASGAIAAVMGAYMVLYPKARVMTAIPIFLFIQIVVLPAPLFLGVWFLLQLLQGTVAMHGVEAGGVAWWAHIGGFAIGYVGVRLGRALGWFKPPVDQRLARTERISHFRWSR